MSKEVYTGPYFGTDQTIAAGESKISYPRFSLSQEAARRLDVAGIPQNYSRPFTRGLDRFLQVAMKVDHLIAVGLVAAPGADVLGSQQEGILVEAAAYWRLPKVECDWYNLNQTGMAAVVELEEKFDRIREELPRGVKQLVGVGGVWGMSHEEYPSVEDVRQTLEDGTAKETFIHTDVKYDLWGLATIDELKQEKLPDNPA